MGQDRGSAAPGPLQVSAIIPVFNDEKHLSRAIQSVLGQPRGIQELIVVDDGSTDLSGRIADDATSDARVTVIHQPNAGPGAAANAGLSRATATHILFVDSDDWIADGMIDVLASVVAAHDPDVISFAASVVDQDGNSIPDEYHHYDKLTIDGTVSGVDYYRLARKSGWVTASSKTYLWRREFIQRMRLRVPETMIYEDEVFTPMAIVCAESVASISDRLYVRTDRPDSLTRRPQTAMNTRFRLESSALLLECAPGVEAVAGHQGREIMEDRSRQLVRISIIESTGIGNLSTLRDLMAERLGGSGPRRIGWLNWLLLSRSRLGSLHRAKQQGSQ
jgi:hypothetical protein